MQNKYISLPVIAVVATLSSVSGVHADVVTQWNETAADLTVAGVKSPSLGNHILAMTQTAVYTAVNGITQQYPDGKITIDAAQNASIDAAVASASHAMLSLMVPSQKANIDSSYEQSIEAIKPGDHRELGIEAGVDAAAAVVAWRDSLPTPPSGPYRPITTPGGYIPTPNLAGPGWGNRPTWLLPSPDALRPGAPPALDSETWAADYNEVLALGAKDSTSRTEEQTIIAKFWEATAPTIYFPVIRSVAATAGRDVTQNARLLAIAGQAMDDALVAVFEAKYHYHFWRPVTAIRNGDQDDNDGTERIADWQPLISTPMHPEYPCAHCVVSGAVAGVLNAELEGSEPTTLSTTSPLLPDVTRSWSSPDEFAQEVADARIFDGVHYRSSAIAGTELGMEIGQLAFDTALTQ